MGCDVDMEESSQEPPVEGESTEAATAEVNPAEPEEASSEETVDDVARTTRNDETAETESLRKETPVKRPPRNSGTAVAGQHTPKPVTPSRRNVKMNSRARRNEKAAPRATVPKELLVMVCILQ